MSLKHRVAKLEQRGKRPSVIYNSVARFTPDGRLVASLAQEGLIRLRRERP